MSVKDEGNVGQMVADFYKNCRTSGKWWVTMVLETNKSGGILTRGESDDKMVGAKGLQAYLSDNDDQMIFAALRVATKDDAGSIRDKFVYGRFIGDNVGGFKKGKISVIGSKIHAHFTSKHISLDLNSDNVKTNLTAEYIAKELLRVGGAHKPDQYQVGPGDDDVYVSNESGVGKNVEPKSFIKKIVEACAPKAQVVEEPISAAPVQPEPVVDEPVAEEPIAEPVEEVKEEEVVEEEQKKKVVVFVLTNNDALGDTGKKTGWYLPEVSHPWEVLKKGGCDILWATPTGGAAPIDEGSIEAFKDDQVSKDFLDSDEYKGLDKTLKYADVSLDGVAAVFYPGGYGPMWDLASDKDVAAKTSAYYNEQNGVVAAVCHGPCALVEMTNAAGEPLVKGKDVTVFSNAEEEVMGLADMMKEQSFLVEDKFKEQGGNYKKADDNWGVCVCVSERLITGQNPNSAKGVGEALLKMISPAE